jgi:hypothetical protein
VLHVDHLLVLLLLLLLGRGAYSLPYRQLLLYRLLLPPMLYGYRGHLAGRGLSTTLGVVRGSVSPARVRCDHVPDGVRSTFLHLLFLHGSLPLPHLLYLIFPLPPLPFKVASSVPFTLCFVIALNLLLLVVVML